MRSNFYLRVDGKLFVIIMGDVGGFLAWIFLLFRIVSAVTILGFATFLCILGGIRGLVLLCCQQNRQIG